MLRRPSMAISMTFLRRGARERTPDGAKRDRAVHKEDDMSCWQRWKASFKAWVHFLFGEEHPDSRFYKTSVSPWFQACDVAKPMSTPARRSAEGKATPLQRRSSNTRQNSCRDCSERPQARSNRLVPTSARRPQGQFLRVMCHSR